MRKAEREVKDFKLVEALLNRAEYIHLAVWDGRTPYVVPVSFGYRDRAIYFHCSYKGKKADCLRGCDRVGFEAVVEYSISRQLKPCDFTAHFKSVSGTGRAVFVEDAQEKRAALDLIMSHYDGPGRAYDDKVLAVTAVVRIDVEEMTGKANPPWQGDEEYQVLDSVGGQDGAELSSAD